jgi:hypothetical protein
MSTIDLSGVDNDDTGPLTGEFAALAHIADGLDGEAHANSGEGIMQAQQEELALDQTQQNAQQIHMVLSIAVPMLSPMFPSLADIYTDHQNQIVGAALAPVLTKYGISLGGMSDKPEIAALIVLGPLAFATYKGVKSDIEARNLQLPKGAPGNPMHAQPAAPVGEPVRLG